MSTRTLSSRGVKILHSINNNGIINGKLKGKLYISSKYSSKTPKVTGPNLPETTTLSGDKIDPWHGSYHWIYERTLSVATLSLVGGAMLTSHRMIDLALGVVLPLHCHLGFDTIITDYLPKRKFPLVFPIAKGLLYVGTLGCIYGLYQYNTSDVGITEGFARIWKANSNDINTEK